MEFVGLSEAQQDWLEDYFIQADINGTKIDEDYIFEKLCELVND